ncbi:MAG: hypothetical protein NZM26_04205, partial [Patescibacteria group bacterium]|nr:hypothetical protein [Patescibacteria group bacterium]
MKQIDFLDLTCVPIEAIYQEIGRLVFESIGNKDWITAKVFAEIEDNSSGTTYGRYTTKESSDYSLSFDTDYRMYLAFDEIRERM